MATPLLLLYLILSLAPAAGLLKGWENNGTSMLLAGDGLVLIYGLIEAFRLMGQNRDLFPSAAACDLEVGRDRRTFL